MNVIGSSAPQRIARWGLFLDQEAPSAGLDPILVAAIMDRESGGGDYLKPLGPKGTGDFGKRNPARWKYELPPDGGGWGRGLMQVDYGGHLDFCLIQLPDGTFAWQQPQLNIREGCGILHAARTALANVAGNYVTAAMICAYNAGQGAAFRAFGALAGGGAQTADSIVKALDMVTTGGNYVSDVLRRRAQFSLPPAP